MNGASTRKRLPEESLSSAVDVGRQSADGALGGDVAKVPTAIARTLQSWLKSLVEDGRPQQDGKGPVARHRRPRTTEEEQKETKARQATPGEKTEGGSATSLRRTGF